MQNIVIEKPYQFVPPYRRTFWSALIQKFDIHGIWLKKGQGVVSQEVRNIDRLNASIAAGHGVLIAPNHSRYADPLLMGYIATEAKCHVYAMASWHLFNQGWMYAWAIHKMGGFSIYREGVDRAAINTAIDILVEADRPLVVFPEGAVTRTNDRLHALLDGVGFVARTAAKKRAKQNLGEVVVHPIAIRYFFQGDIEKTAAPVLKEIETRLSWQPQEHLPLMDRMYKVGRALLSLKELEHFGEVQQGTLTDRLQGLINRLLDPLEEEWFGKTHSTEAVVPRVKALRMKIMPDMLGGKLDEAERARRWEQLADIYLSQQVSCYPPDYLNWERVSVDRILETIERFEEDLTDQVRVHGKLHAVLDVQEAIPVSTERVRGEQDPLMAAINTSLQSALEKLSEESTFYEPSPNA